MKSFVRFCVVSVALAALVFFCEDLRTSFFSEPDAAVSVSVTSDSLTDPAQNEHSFIKFNMPCLSSPMAEGQTVTRTVTGASASSFRHVRRTVLDLSPLAYKSFYGFTAQRLSLPTLRKLRL